MKKPILSILSLAILFVVSTALTTVAIAGKEAPKIPGITEVKPGETIEDIKSDPFKMSAVTIEGGVMKIKVSYSGGHKDHDFALYWDGLIAKSFPPQTTVVLKHDGHGDAAEKLITQTLEFNLAEMGKPMIITVINDHGDKIRVKYGSD